MSLNAFYNAFGNTQNALGDPRGDARKREQEDMLNAIKRREMQMKEYEFGQTQAEAQRAERERQLLADRARRDWDARNYPGNRQPAMGASPVPPPMPAAGPQMDTQAQSAPMTPMNVEGAAIQPQAPLIDPATGREIDQVTVTGTQPMARMDQGDYRKRLLKLALDAGDTEEAIRVHSEIQAGMSDQERMGRQQLAAAAGRIIELPTHEQRVRAAQAAMEQYNIDPAETQIDDHFNDPEMLVFALSNVLDDGSIEDAIKGNLAVNKFRREQMAEQEFAPVSALNLGNEQLLYGGTGDVVDRFRVGVSPNTTVTAGVQRRGQDISAATTRRGQNMTAATAAKASGVLPTVVSIREVKP